MQDWVDRYFPTREFFAPLAAYLLRIAPRYEAAIKEFRQRRFGIYTIGMQIRRRKCDNNREDLHCEGRPTIQAGPCGHDAQLCVDVRSAMADAVTLTDSMPSADAAHMA